MQVRLVTKTEGVEGTEYYGKSTDEIIVGKCRLSSSRETNYLFDEPYKLLRHCIIGGHWSVFDQCHLGFEITTSRAMGRELLRHYSIHPQEVSQRYKEITEFEDIEIRVQSKSNRQSSTEVFDPIVDLEAKDLLDSYYDLVPLEGELTQEQLNGAQYASGLIEDTLEDIKQSYAKLLNAKVARESARFILPEAATTMLHMQGSVRSWITMLNVRLHQTAQKEIRLIAEVIKDELIKQCPIISKALYNFEDAYDIHILERIILEKYKVYSQVKDKLKI